MARTLLASLTVMPLASFVIELAETIGDSMLRALGALHLASAWAVQQTSLTTVCAYDRRLISAAQDLDLETTSPGS